MKISDGCSLTPSLPVREVAYKTFHAGMIFGSCLQNVWTFTGQPFQSCQHAKIHTTFVWNACERKSRSNAHRRSIVGLLICSYLAAYSASNIYS